MMRRQTPYALYRPAPHAPDHREPINLCVSTDTNPFTDLDLFIQNEILWASNRHLKNWPRCFLSRDGWPEWQIADGAW